MYRELLTAEEAVASSRRKTWRFFI